MTNAEINRLSSPVVRAYLDMEDEILALIGKQLGKDKRLSDTSKWRIRQLARAGEINRRAMEIIASYSEGLDAEIYDALLEAAEGEVGKLDDAMLSLLSEKGKMTDEQMQMMQAFERQSRQDLNIENAKIAGSYAQALSEDCNLVNTVMGYQAQSTFVSAVNQIYAETERQRVLDQMNAGAMSVVSGNESLQEATRKTIKRIAEKGIPGFVDKAGREWSPEAYVRMDLRSTMGNTARAAQDARCDRYGISLIEVSSHMGARPKCAPYQGRIFSRDGTRGVTEDINGRQIEYIPLSETSYGEPDGLFGINCGHQQYPFIPGVSLQRYYPYDEEENAERYREFQQQRALERKIRADKRECMMLQAAGDEEGLRKAAGRLRADKDKYSDFNKQHHLGAHPENTQVYGYDRSKSMKTVWAEKELNAVQTISQSNPQNGVMYMVTPKTINNAKSSVSSCRSDVTNEYIQKAAPDKGLLSFDAECIKNKKYYDKEISFAKWIHHTLGGDIKVNEEIHIKDHLNPDYLWNNKLWDLKTPEKISGANSLTRTGIKQIKPNPGGVMLNFEYDISFDELQDILDKRMQWYHNITVDIMIIVKGKLVKVLRYTK